MHKAYSHNLARRRFLKRSLQSLAGGTLMTTVGSHLSLAQAAVLSNTQKFDDYKALVCVFLYGGNDSFNMLVPTANSEYQIYQQVRQNLAFAQQDLLPVSPKSEQPFALGMPPAMHSLYQLFSQQKLSIVANVGPMLQPANKQQIYQDESILPPQLFSHNDQQNHWQTALPSQPAVSGWAGRMADLLMESSASLSLNLSIDGNNLLQTGFNSVAFPMATEGPESFEALDPKYEWNRGRNNLFERIMSSSNHILENNYRNVLNSAATNNATVSEALESAPATDTNYPVNNYLAEQLNMVAQLISVQQILAQPRQIFFVGLGGWDTHDDQSTRHPQLLSVLGDALAGFQTHLESLGVADQVTTFTLSDFGRTLTSNGDGTDHGWGGHQLVMGGAVNGGDIFGILPSLALNSADDLGDGRIIPSLSVDQYAATLASWFGLTTAELNTVFPNLNRFDTTDLGIFG